MASLICDRLAYLYRKSLTRLYIACTDISLEIDVEYE